MIMFYIFTVIGIGLTICGLIIKDLVFIGMGFILSFATLILSAKKDDNNIRNKR